MNRILLLAVLVVALALLAGCAPDPNPSQGRGDEPAGFLAGLWHGFIMLFTFIYSLFSKNVAMYEVNNNGLWYNLGYLIGASAFFGGSGGGACSSRKR